MKQVVPVRVAVLGTGLAGLVAAYLLQTMEFTKEDGTPLHFQVELFEKSPTLGMDNSSISVEAAGGSFRLDTPMRSINGGSHSNVFRLYKHLDIALRRSDFSYSFSRLARPAPSNSRSPSPTPPPPYSESSSTPSPPSLTSEEPPIRPHQSTHYLYEGSNGLIFPPLALPSHIAAAPLLTRLRYLIHLALLSLSYLHLLLLAFLYFSAGLTRRSTSSHRPRSRARRIADMLGLGCIADEEVGKWCERHWVWKGMREEVLVPLYAAVSTVGREEARVMPVGECLDYIVDTFGASHYVAEVGVQQVVRRLAAPFPLEAIHLGCTITSIARASSSGLSLSLSDGPTLPPFNHLIFATQANQAASLLASSSLPPTPELDSLIHALQEFTYVSTLVVNHTDESILPPLEADRRDLNLASIEVASSASERKEDREDRGTRERMPRSSVQATHIIGRTHPRLGGLGVGVGVGVEGGGRGGKPLLLLQTTNPLVPIKPDHVLSSTWYERAAVSKGSKTVLPLFLPSPSSSSSSSHKANTEGPMQNLLPGIWFCGSWCAEGIPLLEGCVSSAMEVVRGVVKSEGGREVGMPF